MVAAAEAHHATGAPIGVHRELGTAAPDAAELLCGQLQVPADRVILGHLNRLPDSLPAAAGGREPARTLAFERAVPARPRRPTGGCTSAWPGLWSATAIEDQILIGGDTATAAARASTGGGPGLPYLLRVLRPRLAAELGDAGRRRSSSPRNPARAFSWA